ncbi:MAG: hypothetical protein KF684_10975 [Phycisphaeraceae bacterium]|nr:hypothetical protein [Phycisphaeraceae bacterium]
MDQRSLKIPKTIALVCFLILVACTYTVRGKVIELNEVRLSSDHARAEAGMEAFLGSYEARRAAYDAERAVYERDMRLFNENLEEFLREQSERRMSGMSRAPQMPMPPQTPEVTSELARINAEFRAARHEYFKMARWLNLVAGLASLGLVGSLVYLAMTDRETGRWVYLGVLSVAFVFLIGPSFHTVLSSIVSALKPPPYESFGYGWMPY